MEQNVQTTIPVNDDGLVLALNTINMKRGTYANIVRRGIVKNGFFTTNILGDRYSSETVTMGSRFSKKNLYAVHDEFLAKAQEEQNLNTLKEWALEQ